MVRRTLPASLVRVQFLGTGNARGLPVYGSDSDVSNYVRAHPELYRAQSSVLLQCDAGDLLLDAGKPDVCYDVNPQQLHGICISHFHSDHVLGLVAMKWGKGCPVDIFYPQGSNDYADLLQEPGLLNFEAVDAFESYQMGPFSISPIPLIHNVKTFGYAIDYNGERLVYLCDTCGLPEESLRFVRSFRPRLAIVDCNQATGAGIGSPHNDLSFVQSIQERTQVKSVYITHIGEGMQRWLMAAKNELPPGIYEARDGLCVDI